MELLCYLHPGWKPLVRPAPATRAWMDATPEAFAYRCLPLNIANAHGWEILTPFGFEARWNGGNTTADVQIRLPADVRRDLAPVSLFGQGVLTFHIFGLFRTAPAWNLWIGGSPNTPKDGIYPLTGIVETDWSPYTFTMNWRFTRPDHWVRFEADEPICFVFPIQRGYLDRVTPKFVPMERDPELMRQFKAWSASRDSFQAKVAEEQPAAGSEKWQKRYYRGVDMRECQAVPDHQVKPRLAPFALGKPEPRGAAAPPPPAAKAEAKPLATAVTRVESAAATDPASIQRALQAVATELMFGSAPEPLVARLIALGAPESEARRIIETAQVDPLIENGRQLATTLRKRDWLLDTMEKHWHLRPASDRIERRAGLTGEEFLERYYAPGRPVILFGDMADWPALAKWTPAYLKQKVGARPVEFQDEGARKRELPFDRFIDLVLKGDEGKSGFTIASGAAQNGAALAPLQADLGFPDRFLDRGGAEARGAVSVAPDGALSALRHERADSLMAQVVGRKRLKIVAAADVAKLYKAKDAFSEIADLESPEANAARFPALRDLRVYEVSLNPGDMIFMPVGWWHQARSLEFSVSIAYANFRWRNDWHCADVDG